MNRQHLRLLGEYCSIPSISTIPNNPDISVAIDWLKDILQKLGFSNVQSLAVATDFPAVYCESIIDHKAPTVLFYGHLDVQPEGDLSLWSSPPYQLTVKDNLIFARGVSDNKAQHLAALLGISQAIKETRLKWNVKILIESSEEIGSKGLFDIFSKYKKLLRADLLLAIDGETHAQDIPTIYNGCKGIAYYRLNVTNNTTEKHSGYFGGLVENPTDTLCKYLATLTSQGRVIVPGISQLELPPYPKEIKQFNQLSKSSLTRYSRSQLRNNYFSATLDIHSLNSGQTEVLKTSIPSTSSATFSIRLVPGQTLALINRIMQRHCRSFFANFHCLPNLELLTSSNPSYFSPNSKLFKHTSEVLSRCFAKPTFTKRLTATLPVLSLPPRVFNGQIALVGFGLPSSNAHGPNENFSISHFKKAVEFAYQFVSSKFSPS